MKRKRSLPISIIGAGAVGRALATSLAERYPIRYIASRHGRSARRLASRIGGVASGKLESLSFRLRGVILIAVPDDAIEVVVRRLVVMETDVRSAIIFHTSGALSSEVLRPLKKKGASVGSLHPLQTFTGSAENGRKVRGIWIAIEGDRRSVRCARQIARDLGAHAFVMAARSKTLYHAAAVFSSNYFVTLLSVVERIGKEIGFPPEKALRMFEPIIRQTLENVLSMGAADALTGPIARGDWNTVARHRSALARFDKRVSFLYSALAEATSHLAQQKKSR